MAAHVKVVARFRPAHAPGDRIQSGDDAVIVEHKDSQSVSLSRGSDATFTFDHVFPMETTQAHVFEHVLRGLWMMYFKGTMGRFLHMVKQAPERRIQ